MATLQITDLQGRIWFHGFLPEGGEIPVFDWPSGMYILRVSEGELVWTERLLISTS